MEMNDPAVMPVGVKMHPVANQPIEQVSAKHHQHDPDSALQPAGQPLSDCHVHEDRGAGEGHQHQGMADTPNGTVDNNPPHRRLARRNTGHRGDMIGLQGMLHTDKETEKQDGGHGDETFANLAGVEDLQEPSGFFNLCTADTPMRRDAAPVPWADTAVFQSTLAVYSLGHEVDDIRRAHHTDKLPIGENRKMPDSAFTHQ